MYESLTLRAPTPQNGQTFDHFVGLALKWLKSIILSSKRFKFSEDFFLFKAKFTSSNFQFSLKFSEKDRVQEYVLLTGKSNIRNIEILRETKEEILPLRFKKKKKKTRKYCEKRLKSLQKLVR